jgi:two-component system sensor histidine kinase CiaH
MKHFTRKRLPTDKRTIRLTISYLAIMVVMSLLFSLILYQTLPSRLRISKSVHMLPGSSITSSTAPLPASDLDEQLSTIKHDWLRTLTALNIGVWVVGASLSYYLARRTLRPIEEALQTQSRFAADASHQLRTPLTTMQAELEVTLRGQHISRQRATEALRHNLQEVIKLQQLSKALLDLAHGPMTKSAFERVSLSEITGEAINQLADFALSKSIRIIDRVPGLWVYGDDASLAQAVALLLENAVKYSPLGSSIVTSAKQDDTSVLLSIQDHGPGILNSELSHIFERFYRTNTARATTNVSGHGLGLALAQQIIHHHKGTITVVSAINHGSTFTIHLPRTAQK